MDVGRSMGVSRPCAVDGLRIGIRAVRPRSHGTHNARWRMTRLRAVLGERTWHCALTHMATASASQQWAARLRGVMVGEDTQVQAHNPDRTK